MEISHYRVWTGPCTVPWVAQTLRRFAEPNQTVTIEGTEHVHFSLPSEQNPLEWFKRADLTYVGQTIQLLRKSRIE